MISRRLLLGSGVSMLVPSAAYAFSQGFVINVTGTTGPTITGITLANASFPGGSSTGTVISVVTVTMSTGSFQGSVSLGGTNAADFQLVNSNGVYTLETNGTIASGNYSITLTATQSGISNSPFTPANAFALTGVSAGTMAATITFSPGGSTFPNGATLVYSSAGGTGQTVINSGTMGSYSDPIGPLIAGIGSARFSVSAVRVSNSALKGYDVTFLWFSDTGHGSNNRACVIFNYGYLLPQDTFSSTQQPALSFHTVSIGGDFTTSTPLNVQNGFHGTSQQWRWCSWDPDYTGVFPSTITLPTKSQLQTAGLIPTVPASTTWAAGYQPVNGMAQFSDPLGGNPNTPNYPLWYPFPRFMGQTGEYPGLAVINGSSMTYLGQGSSSTLVASMLAAAEASGTMPWCFRDNTVNGNPLDWTAASPAPPSPANSDLTTLITNPRTFMRVTIAGLPANYTVPGAAWETQDQNAVRYYYYGGDTANSSGVIPNAQLITESADNPLSVTPNSVTWLSWVAGSNATLGASTLTINPGTLDVGPGLQWDGAHLPEYAWIPFVLTGDPFYVMNFQYQAQWALTVPNLPGSAGDINMGAGQPRAQAWLLRTLAMATAATPSSTPSWLLPKSVFTAALGRVMSAYISNQSFNGVSGLDRTIIRTTNFYNTGYGGTVHPNYIGGPFSLCDLSLGTFQTAYFFGSASLAMMLDHAGLLGGPSPSLIAGLQWYWPFIQNWVEPNTGGSPVPGEGAAFCAGYTLLAESVPLVGDAGQQASGNFGGGPSGSTDTCNGVLLPFTSWTALANWSNQMVTWAAANVSGYVNGCVSSPNTFGDMGAYGGEYYAGVALSEQARALGYAVPDLSTGKANLLASFAATSTPVNASFGYQ